MRHCTFLFFVLFMLFVAGCGNNSGSSQNSDTDTTGQGEDANNTSTTFNVPVGAPCNDTGQVCQDGFCATLLPGGYCTAGCDDTECPDGSTCGEINGFAFCMLSCENSDSCRNQENYICTSEGFCDIGCVNDEECGTSEFCDLGICEDRPPTQDVSQTCTRSGECFSGICLSAEFGGVCSQECAGGCTLNTWKCQAGATTEEPDASRELCISSAPIGHGTLLDSNNGVYRFEAPANIASIQIVARGEDPNLSMIIQNITRPSGEKISGGISFTTGFTSPFRLSIDSGHASADIPNNDDPALQPMGGEWSFSVFNDFNTRDVRLFMKTTSDDLSSGRYDLNIFIAPGILTALTASNANNNNHIQDMLARVESIWTKNNMHIGTVRYYDLPDTLLIIDSFAELHSMFSDQTENAPTGALNVFLVREINFEDGSEAAGIAGGIPGTVGVGGTAGSGVAVALQRWAGRASGDDMAHELGHFTGLYHVTEIRSDIHDVIDDTPECQGSLGQQLDECMRSIMFPYLLTDQLPFSQGFSTTQGRVLRINPQTY